MLEQCASHETLVWLPDAIIDGDLLMFLRAARSMAAFVGWCDGGSTDDGCAAASMDEITINSLHLLHQHEYDTGRALQALVKVINPKSVDKRWSDDDAKKFVRGLKQHGKNFFKIRRDLLANKETSQLVEYYYLWKKTPAASTTRPHRRHRRPVLRRQAPTPTLPSNEELEDLSSASEGSDHESDEDDADALSTNTCFDCNATKSSSWYEQENHVVCANCVRKYNGSAVDASSGDAAEDASEPPPFMFRPVKEEIEWKHDVADAVKHVANGVKREPGGHSGTASGERTSPSGESSCSGSMASHLETSKAENMVNGQATRSPRSPNDLYQDTGNRDETDLNQAERMHRSDHSSEYSNLDKSSKLVPPQDSFTVDSESLSFHQKDWKHKETLDKKPEYQVDGRREDAPHALGREDNPAAPWYRFNPVESFEMFNSAYGAKSDCQTGDFRRFPSPASLGAIKSEPPLLELGSEERATKSAKWSEQGVPHSFLPPWNAMEIDQSLDKSASRSEFDSRNSLRAVASVVPTQMSGGGLLEEGLPSDSRHSLPHYPPPLVPLRGSPEPHRSVLDSSVSAASADHRFDSESRHFAGGRIGSSSNLFDRHSPPPHMMDRSRSPSGCRVEESESDSEREHARRSPSPEPQQTNIEFYRSKSAVFIKRWHRGYNSCSRCDLEFVPLPNSALVRRREERAAARAAHVTSHKTAAAPVSVVKDGRKMENKPNRDYDDKKKVNTPPANQSSDAQITSSLMGPGHHLPIFGPTERLTPREPFPIGHDPTPALRQLSEYARPHIGVSAAAGGAPGSSGRDMQRCMPYGLPGLPPGHPGMDPFLRMPGVYPPGSREALEMEMERDKREREAWERQMRDIRELEFMEKMKQEMDLKLPGFDRLAAAAAAGQLDPLWLAELQRRYVTSGGPPPPPGHMPGVFQPSQANVAADLIQRERERIDREMAARSSQEQQQMAAAAAAAARDNGAIYQLYQRYAHDPAALQRHLSTYLAMSASKAHDNEVARMMDASHLVYHFARADPLSAAGSSNAQGGPPQQMGPPQSLPSHGMPPGGMANHPLIAAAREQERAYLDLLSRPPYSTDPIMAQQLSLQLAAQQDAIQRQLAMERECLGGGPPGSMMMH